MSFIEGIGDEVTAFFVILIVVVLATLVTFIGSGSHLYSPIHARAALPTAQADTVSQQSPELTNRRNSDNNRPPYDTLTVNWPTSRSGYYQEDHPQNRSVEDVSDDTEEQSSSDDGRPSEFNPDILDSETPTAPLDDTLVEEMDENISSSGGIRVRLKYLDDTERTVRSNPTTKIGDFKRNHFPDDLANNKIVRLIFCGHLLRDNSTLESYRVLDNSVIHVQILQAQTEQPRSPVSQNADLDLSHLLWPLVSVVLGICWVFYFKYPEFFSVISLSLLFVFTASFFVFYTHVHQLR